MTEPDRSPAERRLLEFLQADDYRPMPLREVLRRLDVPREERPEVRRAARELIREGVVARTRDNRLTANVRGGLVRGRLQLHRDGYGFVVPEEGGADLFVAPRRLGGAAEGDIVAARIVREGRAGEREAEIVEVLDRRSRRVVGLFRARDRAGYVTSFDPRQSVDVLIPGAFRMGALDGDAVAVEVLRSLGPEGPNEGKIVEVLGPLDAPGVQVEVVVRRYGLLSEFAEETLAAAEKLPAAVPADEAARRERFDDPPVVTIDGETARDFDDAIAVAELGGGAYRLWVHIADVAFFVATGSPLDREARVRGTSVYFPERVLPMFPEKVSNHLCSLVAGEDRLVQTAVMDIDADGRIRAVRFADGVIRSAARLTYTSVAEFLATGERSAGMPARIAPMLRAADALRTVLERRRHARGSVDFDLPEPRILLDVEGAMTGIKIEPRNVAHRMIEEFMLAANEAVAGHLDTHDAPCLYRVHESPDPVKVEALREFAAGFGLDLRADPERLKPRDIQRLLESAEGRPEQRLIAQVALRSMKQARYTGENSGHFGLAAPVYAHFTSPIRRYPDLVVHRALRALRHKRKPALAAIADGLEALGESCSRLERAAEAAEREVLEWKKIGFMQGKEGQVFDGLVTAVVRFGLFVQLTDTMVEGLVHVENLGGDYFEHDERRMELRAARSGSAFRLGDPIRVRLVRVDPVLRRIDLVPEDADPAGGRRAGARGGRRAAGGTPAVGSHRAGSRPAGAQRAGGQPSGAKRAGAKRAPRPGKRRR